MKETDQVSLLYGHFAKKMASSHSLPEEESDLVHIYITRSTKKSRKPSELVVKKPSVVQTNVTRAVIRK